MVNRADRDPVFARDARSDDGGVRRSERHKTFCLAELTSPHCDAVGEVLDISATGLKLQIASGAMPIAGEPVTVCLVRGTYLSAHVAWLDGKNVGIEFDQPREDAIEMTWPQDHAQDWYGRLVQLQLKRSDVNNS